MRVRLGVGFVDEQMARRHILDEERYLSRSKGLHILQYVSCRAGNDGGGGLIFLREDTLFRTCNRLTDRLKYSAAVQAMDLSNRDDSNPVRYSAAYPTGAERFF